MLIECKTLCHVVASSAEAETAGIFHNAKVAITLRYIINQMGHLEPATPLKTDNATANSFVYDNITQKKLKSWDMWFYWLQNKNQNHNFDIYWDSGLIKLSSYYTKHHTSQHHKDIIKTYVRDKLNYMPSQYMICVLLRTMQGCN